MFVAICILNHTVRFSFINQTLFTGEKLLKTNSYENIISSFILQSVKIHDVNKVLEIYRTCITQGI